jgi:hypothetical protein
LCESHDASPQAFVPAVQAPCPHPHAKIAPSCAEYHSLSRRIDRIVSAKDVLPTEPSAARRLSLTCGDNREFYEAGRDPDVSLPQEIVGTVIFTAGMVGAILFVLSVFIL